MKNLRRYCVIATLILTLSLSALADEGQMEFPLAAPPPDRCVAGWPCQTTSTPNGADESQAPDEAAIDPLTEVALSLMRSVMSLF